MENKDIGYLAGVLDGEGCIHASKPWKKETDRKSNGRHHFDIRIIINNTSRNLLEKVERLLDEADIKWKERPCQRKKNNKQKWEISITRKSEIKKLLKLVIDDLACKKRSAEVVLDFLKIEQRDMGNKPYPKEYIDTYIKVYNILKKQKGKSPLTVEAIRQTS